MLDSVLFQHFFILMFLWVLSHFFGIRLYRKQLNAFSYDIIILLLMIGNAGRVTGLLVH